MYWPPHKKTATLIVFKYYELGGFDLLFCDSYYTSQIFSRKNAFKPLSVGHINSSIHMLYK